MKKVLIRVVVNSLLGLVLIFIWSRFVNFNELINTLKTTNIQLALVFFLFFCLSSFIRSLRLKFLLIKQKVSLKDLIYVTFLGQFLSFMVPIRAGEIAKSVFLFSQYKLPLSHSIVWILLDRFLDFWTNLALVGILIMFTKSNVPGNFGALLFLIFASFSLISLFMIYKSDLTKSIVIFFTKKTKIGNITNSIIDGFEVLRRKPLDLLILLALSLSALISDALMWLYVLLALGVQLGHLEVLLGSLLSALTFLIPAAPGYIGSAEASTLAVFSGVLRLPANLASAAAVLYHILAAFALPVTGILSLYLLKFDLNLVWKQIKRS